MNAQRANEIQVLLEGVDLPASRDELVRYAMGEDDDAAVVLQQRLPDQQYTSIDEVGELLLGRVQDPDEPAPLPTAESGKPPGGDDYTRPFPEPGAVREPEPRTDVLQKQSETQKKQQAKQES